MHSHSALVAINGKCVIGRDRERWKWRENWPKMGNIVFSFVSQYCAID